MSVRLKWDGARVSRLVTGRAASVVQRVTQAIAASVRVECPVRSGDLLSTIREEQEPGSNGLRYRVVAGGAASNGKTVDYAGYVEFGRSRSRANPFFRRGIEHSRNRVRAIRRGRV